MWVACMWVECLMHYFFKNYIYIYIYFLIFLYTAFPPTFPFFEGLFRIVPVSETSYHFLVSCNLGGLYFFSTHAACIFSSHVRLYLLLTLVACCSLPLTCVALLLG
jgi:hypothetical protein